jgi:transcription elongation factor S-II
MDVKQVEEYAKAVNKAQNSKEPAANIISILKKLQSGVKPTEELLRSTRVGVYVNRLKTHDNKDVARLASEVVSKWRNEIKNAGGSTPKAANGANANTKNGTASPAPSEKPQLSVPPDKRTNKTDKIDLKKCTGDTTRDSCVGLMYDGLAFMNSTDQSAFILRKATAVEQAVYDANKRSTSTDYKNKIRSLFQNLKNKSNPKLRKDVLNGGITPERFARMTSDEMKSEERKKEEEKIKKENMNNAMVAQEEVSISASLQCGKCGQKKVSYTQAQTRSADEPMTTYVFRFSLFNLVGMEVVLGGVNLLGRFCTCTVCGNRWKFS